MTPTIVLLLATVAASADGPGRRPAVEPGARESVQPPKKMWFDPRANAGKGRVSWWDW
jgi:hypothetical protein